MSLVLLLIFPLSNAAVYRNKHRDSDIINLNHQFSINLLTKGVPIPPSGSSKRHNVQPDRDGSSGSVSTMKEGRKV
ncbi:hypothetical protein F3Y22_tig00117007pilonHSYRG00030 [Hibiscus syriacus]|uniref:Uncharacterized protein n=1 Tax=Hibiscus syriacus TaxID=106335 RepID=A0A6A2XCK0_HIBSY|nr:hypothetical protein F3Y22_tig00117007pilonHSYRG00030 [Hibiscus syriacus]